MRRARLGKPTVAQTKPVVRSRLGGSLCPPLALHALIPQEIQLIPHLRAEPGAFDAAAVDRDRIAVGDRDELFLRAQAAFVIDAVGARVVYEDPAVLVR